MPGKHPTNHRQVRRAKEIARQQRAAEKREAKLDPRRIVHDLHVAELAGSDYEGLARTVGARLP